MKNAIVWFRNDLRTRDNQVLSKAVQENDRVMAFYFFDPRAFEVNQFGFKRTEKHRAQFLIETLTDLKNQLEQLNISLFIFQQQPEDVFPQFIDNLEFKIHAMYSQKEWTRNENRVTDAVKSEIKRFDVDWIELYDQFLFHPEDVPFEINDTPKIYTVFRKKCEKYVKVRPVVSVEKMSKENLVPTDTEIPSLQQLGFSRFYVPKEAAFTFKGGSKNAKRRIENYFWETENLKRYKETRNGLVGEAYSSKLSAWLANGSISARSIYHEVKRFEEEVVSNDSTYWLIFELIWRDYFKYVSLKHRDKIFQITGILDKDYEWSTNSNKIKQWIDGETEEPFVNANMLELKFSGWMSNRGRQNVASFFAKEKELDWRIGASYFESQLVDYDVHSNYGNWMYVAGVGNDPRNRKFNIQRQAERYDPQQEFQNLWLEQIIH
ncbi:DASH family cryptochrome [Aquimarina sp. ERC-38]|uniref:DASH family cryptochrome n=1 Tax=Aquimarina sp. ERC-38 TaxID=2949996 RepID=UPI0022482040|nr:DASH family cryptochrome [Aquimarina sp. ERC-38]UZO82418.1 DASH family cryptochrome [Aquimarina sp. ERC-38]